MSNNSSVPPTMFPECDLGDHIGEGIMLRDYASAGSEVIDAVHNAEDIDLYSKNESINTEIIYMDTELKINY